LGHLGSSGPVFTSPVCGSCACLCPAQRNGEHRGRTLRRLRGNLPYPHLFHQRFASSPLTHTSSPCEAPVAPWVSTLDWKPPCALAKSVFVFFLIHSKGKKSVETERLKNPPTHLGHTLGAPSGFRHGLPAGGGGLRIGCWQRAVHAAGDEPGPGGDRRRLDPRGRVHAQVKKQTNEQRKIQKKKKKTKRTIKSERARNHSSKREKYSSNHAPPSALPHSSSLHRARVRDEMSEERGDGDKPRAPPPCPLPSVFLPSQANFALPHPTKTCCVLDDFFLSRLLPV